MTNDATYSGVKLGFIGVGNMGGALARAARKSVPGKCIGLAGRTQERVKALAEELDLPVIVHDREAHADSLAVVREFPRVRGVFHCFSGSAEMAEELVRLGWMVSFTGVLTYKNARRAVEAARAVPLERIMIETDSPYMAPAPHRGKRNDSGYVRHVCEKLAEIKGISFEECARITLENGKRFYGIAE